MTTRRRLTSRRTRAMLQRTRKRAANTQIAQVAEVLNDAALTSLGVQMGTAQDGRLVMSRTDWARAVAVGAVRISAPTE